MRNDYGAGGGNFIGVSADVDVNSGVGDPCRDSDGDSIAVGDGDGATVADACGDDVGDACHALAGRSLENGISAIRATSIGTTTPTTTAHFRPIQNGRTLSNRLSMLLSALGRDSLQQLRPGVPLVGPRTLQYQSEQRDSIVLATSSGNTPVMYQAEGSIVYPARYQTWFSKAVLDHCRAQNDQIRAGNNFNNQSDPTP